MYHPLFFARFDKSETYCLTNKSKGPTMRGDGVGSLLTLLLALQVKIMELLLLKIRSRVGLKQIKNLPIRGTI